MTDYGLTEQQHARLKAVTRAFAHDCAAAGWPTYNLADLPAALDALDALEAQAVAQRRGVNAQRWGAH